MLYLVTGRPGASKSLNSIKSLVEDKAFWGRAKFYHNVKYFLLDYEFCCSFGGWFIGVFYASLDSGSPLQKRYSDLIRRVHDEGRQVSLSDFPHLKPHFLHWNDDEAFELWLSWVKKLYPAGALEPLNEASRLISDKLSFQHVEALNYHFKHFPDPTLWPSLPANSILFADECQDWMPVRDYKTKPAEFISAFEKHRHKAFDGFFVSQHPKFLDIHFRRLVGRHIHFYNPFGGKNVTRVESSKDIDVDNSFELKEADSKTILRDTRFYGVYWSADNHTHRFRFPRKVMFILAVVFVGICYLGYSAYNFFFSSSLGSRLTGNSKPSAVVSSLSSSSSSSDCVDGVCARLPVKNSQNSSSPQALEKVLYKPKFSSSGFMVAKYHLFFRPSAVEHPLSNCVRLGYGGFFSTVTDDGRSTIERYVICYLGEMVDAPSRDESENYQYESSVTYRISDLSDYGYRLVSLVGGGYRLRYGDAEFALFNQ